MLREFVPVSCHHQLILVFVPNLRNKVFDKTPTLLCRCRCPCCKYFPRRHFVSEQSRLPNHHPMLRGLIADTIHFKRRNPPLTKTAFGNSPIPGRLMTPEKK